MSHLHERNEKTCLNCRSGLTGRFCHNCGQENIEPKESFLHLLQHFFEDFTHFDGKLFTTLKPLFIKPGFLSEQYILGRRASYLNPIRMYLFISALFFLLLMTFFIHPGKKTEKKKEPSALRKGLSELSSIIDSIPADTSAVTTVNGKKIYEDDYETPAQYDSMQKMLPEEKRDGFIEQYFARKTMSTMEYSKENPQEVKHRMVERFFHSLPYMLFLTLPFMAFLLQLLFWRKKQFYYVSHIIFMLHVYCFAFLVLILAFSFQQFGHPGQIIGSALKLSVLGYLFLAMLRFYKQHIGKTLVKFLLLFIMGGIIICLLTLVMVVNTFLNLAS